ITTASATFIIGGHGNDQISVQDPASVVAFNRGDDYDLLFPWSGLTLSLGGGITLDDLAFVQSGQDLVLELGAGDAVYFSKGYVPTDDPWPAIRLQIIGDDIRVFDLSAAMASFGLQSGADPDMRLPAASILSANLISVSSTHAYGGDLAYRHATTGTAFADAAEALVALDDPAFGHSAQLVSGTVAPPLVASDSDDVVGGSDAPETVAGGTGADWLDAGAGDDVLTGGPGSDLLMGGAGADTYAYAVGDGVDTIWDPSSTTQSNTLVFGEGISSEAITLGLGSLVLRIGDTGGAIHLASFDALDPFGPRDIDRFVFSDGTWTSYEDLLARGFDISGSQNDDVLTGTALTDRISGDAGTDMLDGLAGDDVLSGGVGNDSYRFGRGYGEDRIREGGIAGETDVVILSAGLSPADIALDTSGPDLILTILGTNDRLVIERWLDAPVRVEEVRFADGTKWNETYLATGFSRPPVYAGTLLDQAAFEDLSFLHELPSTVFSDPDGAGTLTLVATRADGGGLPAWLTFDPVARSFSGIPGNDDVDAFDITVIATDPTGLSASGSFLLAVINTNDAPAVAGLLPPLEVLEDEPFEGILPNGFFVDVDVGDLLTVTVSGSEAAFPEWLEFDPVARRLTGLPGNGNVGTHT
ncbi:MAG: putative Ig domain-containing protein, partial [Gammaproteobacteria bacterium]